MIKPDLLDQEMITKIISNKKKIPISNENNIVFFHFLLIVFFILCILFLVYRYIEKNKRKNNSES
jgi:preprotein translocase subunit SecG